MVVVFVVFRNVWCDGCIELGLLSLIVMVRFLVLWLCCGLWFGCGCRLYSGKGCCLLWC